MLACVIFEMENFDEIITLILEYFSIFTIFLVLFLVLFIYTICAELSRPTEFNENDTEHIHHRGTRIQVSEGRTSSIN